MIARDSSSVEYQKGISDRKQGFAATSHQALSKARANSFRRSVSPIKQC